MRASKRMGRTKRHKPRNKKRKEEQAVKQKSRSRKSKKKSTKENIRKKEDVRGGRSKKEESENFGKLKHHKPNRARHEATMVILGQTEVISFKNSRQGRIDKACSRLPRIEGEPSVS